MGGVDQFFWVGVGFVFEVGVEFVGLFFEGIVLCGNGVFVFFDVVFLMGGCEFVYDVVF